jgi:hypothetical protein
MVCQTARVKYVQNLKYAVKLNGDCFFTLDINFIEEVERQRFNEYTSQLLQFSKRQPAFECKGNCKAPSGSYIGAPWIQNNLVKERKGAKVLLHCQVWTKFNSEALQGNPATQTLLKCVIPENRHPFHFSQESIGPIMEISSTASLMTQISSALTTQTRLV